MPTFAKLQRSLNCSKFAKNMSEDLQVLWAAVEGGDAASAFTVGCCFSEGSEGVEKDAFEAARYFKMVVDQGDADVQYNYGVFLEHGEGVKKDVCQATRYDKMAADQGDADAQCRYGYCLEHGKGVERDAYKAARCCKLEADQGLSRTRAQVT